MDEQMQQQIVQLVQAAMNGDQQASQQIQQIMQTAEMIQAVAQQMQTSQQTSPSMAKNGAKLNYIKELRGICPEGYEMQSYKVGGKVCKKCIKKKEEGDKITQNAVDAFKCGRKMKK